MDGEQVDRESRTCVAQLKYKTDSEFQQYIENGGDVNVRDDYNRTLLHHALEMGSLSRVKMLVEAKCDMDALNKVNNLLKSVERNYTDITKFLLEYDAENKMFDADKNSALAMAVYNRNGEMVDLLMAHGADCNAMCYNVSHTIAGALLRRPSSSPSNTNILTFWTLLSPMGKLTSQNSCC